MTAQEKVARLIATIPGVRPAAALSPSESSSDSNNSLIRPATRHPATTVGSRPAQPSRKSP